MFYLTKYINLIIREQNKKFTHIFLNINLISHNHLLHTHDHHSPPKLVHTLTNTTSYQTNFALLQSNPPTQ